VLHKPAAVAPRALVVTPALCHSPPSIGGRRLSDPEVPTNLAQLSVKGARLAIAPVSVHGVIAQEFVDASLVGSGIGDAEGFSLLTVKSCSGHFS
jgi:hypothetical protein